MINCHRSLPHGFRLWFALLAIAPFLPFAVQTGEAQVLYGSIVGNVTDPTDAAVPGAAVEIVQSETNQSRTTKTNASGGYSFPTLPPGTYRVTISARGFQTFTQSSVTVSVNSVVRVDGQLQVGAITESVQVSSAAPPLQTERGEVRFEVGTRALVNLPVPGARNYENLFITVPGVSAPQNMHSISGNPSRSLNFNVNGAGSSSTDIRIDGASALDPWLPHISAYVPALESIQSVDIVTNSFTAEVGQAGGAAINVQIKSGTNQFHGAGFEYLNNSAVKAKPFFLPAGQRQPKIILNQFGGALGGPVKKDKLFFFASYEGTLDRQSANAFGTVPTAAIRSGDMSASPTAIFDPATGTPDGKGRLPFAGNMIPASRLDPIVQKIVNLTPAPTSADLLTNNYFAAGGFSFNRHTLDTKGDWNVSDRVHLSARLSWLKFDYQNPMMFGKLQGPGLSSKAGYPGLGFGGTYSSTVSGIYTLSPNFIVDAYFGYTLLDQNVELSDLDQKIGLDVLGIPGTNGSRQLEGGWPLFSVSSYSTFGAASNNTPWYHHNPVFEYVANFNWTKGSHSVRFGMDLMKVDMNMWEPRGGAAGAFYFTGGVTALNGGPTPNQFNSYADFLLGRPYDIEKSNQVEQMTPRMWADGLYIQDQWQINPMLTLSYGLRWEYYPMATRGNRGMERYDFTNNTMLICGLGSTPRDCGFGMSKKDFAPRFGIAWRPTTTFVVRAGYGISYDPFNPSRNIAQNYPVLIKLALLGSNSYQPAGLLRDGIPPVTGPDLGSGVIPVPGGYQVVTLPDFFSRSYLQSWNLTLEKQLKWGFTGQAGYVATRQIRGQQMLDLNAGRVGGGVASQPLYQRFGRAGITYMELPLGHNHYDSLQTQLRRRFANGYQIGASYTFSKAIGLCCDALGVSMPQIHLPDYLNLNRAVMPFDRTHNFTLTGIAQLPFGSGKRWLSRGGWGAALASGWQINALFSAYSGLPFSVSASGASLNAPSNIQRADQVKPSVQILGGVGPGQSYFDPFAFAPVTVARFGNAGFDLLRGPGLVNLDFGLFRDFRVTERFHMQFRGEVFNLTNTPHFANPGANVSNLQLNSNGTIRSLGGYTQITSTTGAGREGIDERQIRFGLRLSF